jgi:triosephosphate isomerase
MRRFFVAGNWKMNKTIAEAQALMGAMKPELAAIDNVDKAVAPAYLAVPAMVDMCRGTGSRSVPRTCSGRPPARIPVKFHRRWWRKCAIL